MKDKFNTEGEHTQKLEDSVKKEEQKIKTRYDEEMTRKQQERRQKELITK